ncbi:MAG TPA: hypothetical protein VGB44_11280 [Flavobacterium sp.]|jgi:hypothetical protein
MKYLLLIAFSVLSYTASAQENSGTTSADDNQDRIQQEPPRPAQVNVERTVRQDQQRTQNNTSRSDLNTNNSTDVQQVLKNEVEQSTGKESENPAVTNPRTVRPARLADPVSQPVQQTTK